MEYIFTVYKIILFIFAIICQHSKASDTTLEVMNEEELRQLYQEEKYVTTLLSLQEDCTGRCKQLENTLVSIREDLVENTGGWVIRGVAPNVAAEMGLKETCIVFMRSGRPLLYLGKDDDEEHIFNLISSHKDTRVHNLTDSNFEHETQASTGATTGDWLIMFIKNECSKCVKLLPILETVAAELYGRKNVAFVQREAAAVTARRFGVKIFPSIILLRFGKMFKYDLPLFDIASLSAFTNEGFRNAKAESIPRPKSPFDDLTESIADWLRENPWTFIMGLGAIMTIVTFIYLLNRPPPQSWTKKNIKKKEK